MLGAIIGDISGSSYEVQEILAKKNGIKRSFEERIKILDEQVPLFNNDSSCTDDSVLTCAIADAILNNGDYETYIRQYGNRELNLGQDKYGRSRFGSGFVKWLSENNQGNSYGNGSAMRISAVGNLFKTLEEVIDNSGLATIPSHNNIEALMGAEAIATSIFLIKRKKYSKNDIKNYIEKTYQYNLALDLIDLQKNYTFTSKCSGSVPQAIYCFLISNSFEDSIRKAISIGGDSDTIACITGSLSEAYYGIPNKIIENALPYIPEYIISIVDKFYNLDKEVVKTYGK